jgi:NTE family protein
MVGHKSLGKYYLVEGIPLFQGLMPHELEKIVEIIQILELKKGDLIFEEGKGNPYFYAISNGMVEVFQTRQDGKREIQEILRRGDYFGIISLLTNQPHLSSAQCLDDTRLLRIPAKDFRRLIQEIPSLNASFSKILSLTLRKQIPNKRDDIRNTVIGFWGRISAEDNFLRNLLIETWTQSKKDPILLRFTRKQQSSNSDYKYEKIYNTTSKTQIREILESYIATVEFVFLDLTDCLPDVRRILLEFTDELYLEEELLQSEALEKLKHDFPSLQIQIREKAKHNDPKALARKISGRRVGIALGGGAALGLAQVGIMKVCQEEGHKFDMISGTSIGAVIGAYWAAGYSWETVMDVVSEFDSLGKVFRFMDFSFRNGLFSGKNIRSLLDKHLGKKKFSDLEIPLRLIACDITTRTEVEISEGSVIDAVMASVAIPGVFSPVYKEDGTILVDGGIVNPLPVSSLKKQGINRIVAVNSMPSSNTSVKANEKNPTILDIVVNSLYSLQYRIGKFSAQDADVYINPILEHSAWFEFYRGREFMEFGEIQARASLDEIRELFQR